MMRLIGSELRGADRGAPAAQSAGGAGGTQAPVGPATAPAFLCNKTAARLVAAELRKVWRSRFFLLAFAVLLGANLFLLWFGTGRTPGNVPAAAYRTLEQTLAGQSMEEMDAFLHGELHRVEALSHIDSILRAEAWNGGNRDETARQHYAADFAQYSEVYQAGGYLRYGKTLAQEYRFLKTIVLEFEQVSGYEAFLDSIDTKAKQLSSISIFAESESGYDLANIEATAAAFAGMRGIPIQYYPQKGLMTALDFALTDVVAVFAMVLIATVLVRTERDNGLLALVRCTPAGRGKTAAAKLAAFGLSLAAVLLCLYGVNLAYCGGLYGLGPLTRTIQSVPGLMRSTWKLTVGQYLGCFFLTKWGAAFLCGVWVMLAMLWARRLLTGALGALALLGANLLIRSIIPATSNLNVLKYANLVSLLRTNELLGGYRNLYWFGAPVPLLLVECAAAGLFAVLFLGAFYTVFARKYFTAARRQGFAPRLRRRPMRRTTPLRTEWFKLLVLQGGAVLLALCAGLQIYTAVTTESYIDADEIYYRYYMRGVEGAPTQEKLDWLQEQNEEFRPIYQLNAALGAGKITAQEYQAMMSAYGSLQQKMSVFQRVVGQWKALGGKPRMQMVYETGWLKLFDTADTQDVQDALWAALLCAMCFAGFFAMERQTGMVQVIGVTPLGRTHTVRVKWRVALAVSGLLATLSLLPRFWVVLRDYGLGAWTAPVYSIARYANSPELPLFLMAGLLVLSRFAAIFTMACGTLALSQRIGNTFGALFASLLLFALPPLLSAAGLTNAKWCSVYLSFHLCALLAESGGMALAVLLALGCGGVRYLCHEYLMERFASHPK